MVPEGDDLELFDILINKRSVVDDNNQLLNDGNEIDSKEQ